MFQMRKYRGWGDEVIVLGNLGLEIILLLLNKQ